MLYRLCLHTVSGYLQLSRLLEVPGSDRRLLSARWDLKVFKAGIAFCHLPPLPQMSCKDLRVWKNWTIIHLKFTFLVNSSPFYTSEVLGAYKYFLNRKISVLHSEKLTASAPVTYSRYFILFLTILFWNANIIIVGFGANVSIFQSLNTFHSCFPPTRDWLFASNL